MLRRRNNRIAPVSIHGRTIFNTQVNIMNKIYAAIPLETILGARINGGLYQRVGVTADRVLTVECVQSGALRFIEVDALAWNADTGCFIEEGSSERYELLTAQPYQPMPPVFKLRVCHAGATYGRWEGHAASLPEAHQMAIRAVMEQNEVLRGLQGVYTLLEQSEPVVAH